MKATIVIPNINGKGWLKDSIESVYAQTEQNFELIIVDNGSTDESLEQARSYCGRPNFTLIENGTNTGFSHAVNQGIARAKGEYVVMFNNDAFAEPEWLAELIRTAETDPKIFAVQSLMLRHFERELADDAGDYVTWMGFACKTGDGRRASRYTKQKRIFSACGGAALYRKSILEEIGTFDENFFAYFEDVDLSWRANNAGYKCVLCPTAKCYHICGASTGAVKYNAFKSQQSGRNSILLPLKNEPLLMLILNFLPLALGYLLSGGIDWGIRYIAAAVLVYTVGFVFQELEFYKRGLFMPAIAGLVMALTGFLGSFSAKPDEIPLAAKLVLETSLAFGGCYFFREALSTAPRRSETDELRHSSALLISAACVLIAVGRIELFGLVSVGRWAALLLPPWHF